MLAFISVARRGIQPSLSLVNGDVEFSMHSYFKRTSQLVVDFLSLGMVPRNTSHSTPSGVSLSHHFKPKQKKVRPRRHYYGTAVVVPRSFMFFLPPTLSAVSVKNELSGGRRLPALRGLLLDAEVETVHIKRDTPDGTGLARNSKCFTNRARADAGRG